MAKNILVSASVERVDPIEEDQRALRREFASLREDVDALKKIRKSLDRTVGWAVARERADGALEYLKYGDWWPLQVPHILEAPWAALEEAKKYPGAKVVKITMTAEEMS